MRNVLIYFDVEMRRSILAKVRGCLAPHGALLLGTAETTMTLDPLWKCTPVLNATVFTP
jgi:chemotaxis protein methyltransferase CheR